MSIMQTIHTGSTCLAASWLIVESKFNTGLMGSSGPNYMTTSDYHLYKGVRNICIAHITMAFHQRKDKAQSRH